MGKKTDAKKSHPKTTKLKNGAVNAQRQNAAAGGTNMASATTQVTHNKKLGNSNGAKMHKPPDNKQKHIKQKKNMSPKLMPSDKATASKTLNSVQTEKSRSIKSRKRHHKRKPSENPKKPKTKAIEPDKNWKELAKKLGIDPDKKKPVDAKAAPGASKDEESKCNNQKPKEIWFDVDDELIEDEYVVPEQNKKDKDLDGKLVESSSYKGLTKCLAMDCEMVGVGPDGKDSALARISIVNQFGHCVYDKFVKPKEEVTDYRTWVSGVRPEDLENADELEVVQKEVHEMLKDRILVGHAISNDEKALFMNHPRRYIRDTQKYPGYRKLMKTKRPGLKKLTERVLGLKIQGGEHSSVQDAQATMRLYTLIRQKWEALIKKRNELGKLKASVLKKKTKLPAK